MNTKITMIGMGAVGATVGKRLAEFKDCTLTCVADSERKARYEKNGITINGQPVPFTFTLPQDLTPADYIIIATKNLALDQVIGQIKNAVGPNTTILSLLNGIQSEADLSVAYGAEKVLYGYIVSLSSTNVGGSITCGHEGTIVFGEKSNQKTERVLRLAQIFEQAGISYKIPEDIQLAQWKKFMLNVSCNTISSLCRATYGAFNEKVTEDLVMQTSAEVIAVANAHGIALTREMALDNLKMTAALNADGKTSMFQDVEAKRKTENDYFCGTVVALGKQYNIPTPACALLQKLIQCTELSFLK